MQFKKAKHETWKLLFIYENMCMHLTKTIFYSLNIVFEKQNILILMKSTVSILMNYAFRVISRIFFQVQCWFSKQLNGLRSQIFTSSDLGKILFQIRCAKGRDYSYYTAICFVVFYRIEERTLVITAIKYLIDWGFLSIVEKNRGRDGVDDFSGSMDPDHP